MKRSILLCIVVVVLGVTSIVMGETSKILLTFGAPPSSSAVYSYWVAAAKAIQTVYPEFQITVTECQGAMDITKRVRSGLVSVGNSMSNTDYENYNGLGPFDGKPFKDLRIIWYFDITPQQWVVARDANIKTIYDLNGKKFNPGGTGTAAVVITKQIFELLGVKPDYFEASQKDAAEAFVNRQIIGVTKSGPAPDSFVLQLAASIPVALLGLTDEELKKVNEKYPYLIPYTIPAETYKGVGEIKTVAVMMGAQATSKLPQEVGYKMVKAICEGGKSIWAAAYPSAAKLNPVELTLKSKVPLHAGAVQYLKELGYKVPPELIPPEYKDVK